MVALASRPTRCPSRRTWGRGERVRGGRNRRPHKRRAQRGKSQSSSSCSSSLESRCTESQRSATEGAVEGRERELPAHVPERERLVGAAPIEDRRRRVPEERFEEELQLAIELRELDLGVVV